MYKTTESLCRKSINVISLNSNPTMGTIYEVNVEIPLVFMDIDFYFSLQTLRRIIEQLIPLEIYNTHKSSPNFSILKY